MSRTMGRIATAVVAIVGATAIIAAPVEAATLTSVGTAPDPTPTNCTAVLDGVRSGSRAVAELGANVETSARAAGMSTAEYGRVLASDPTFKVDQCGLSFVTIRAPPRVADAQAAAAQNPLAGDRVTALALPDNVFELASRPTSLRTIYLDFDGTTLTGSSWNGLYGDPIVAPAYSVDGDTSSFSDADRAAIYETWQRVSEDFAPLDVNVTTRQPEDASLNRSGNDDETYGTTVLIAGGPDLCSCGAIAFVGSFDSIGDQVKPALVFEDSLASDPKFIADASSHLLGHTLGLSHDGSGVVSQHTGQGSWAPIMGLAYSKPIGQFSSGDYQDATNTEDDFAVMALHGAALIGDDYASDPSTTGVLSADQTTSGLISSPTDTDAFRFDASGTTTITVSVAESGANLDTKLRIYNANDAPVSDYIDPPAATVDTSTASGLGVTYTFTASPGTYYAKVEAAGFGDSLTTGYSSYGSRGAYSITVANTPTPGTGSGGTPTSSGPLKVASRLKVKASKKRAQRVQLVAAGGTSGYTWRATGKKPKGISLSRAGVLTAKFSKKGTVRFSLRVTDSSGTSAAARMSITFK